MQLNKVADQQLLNALDDRQLNLIILPTEKCNFRCTYCYEDFAIGKMSPVTREAIKKFLKSRLNDLRLLEISWFGGEPLLAKEIIYDISRFIIKEKPAGLKFLANITTNAHQLDFDTFKELINCHISKYQVSLDGDDALHNTSRKLAGGQQTFHRIWENILMMHHTSFDFELIIRVHFTIDNFHLHKSLVEKINTTLAGDKRIKIYFKAIERLGGSNDDLIKQLRHSQKKEIKEQLDSLLLDKEQQFSLDTEDRPYICYASQPNSLLIRADGKLGKCTVALNNDKNNIGHITDQGELVINQNLQTWIQGLETLDPQTLACPLSRIDTAIKASEK